MIILRKRIAGVTEPALRGFAARARKAAGLSGEFNVLITSSDEIRDLNRRFRRRDKPTDVLSFPSAMPGEAGDIAISADIACENGCQFGHGALTELKILMLHGMLHLAGLNHETDDGAMARKEQCLRESLGLHEGLIERAHSSPNKTAVKKTAAKKTLKPAARKSSARKSPAPTKATAGSQKGLKR